VTSTVNQSNLPEYAQPYFERMMGRAEAESNQPYVSYGGQRVADFTSDTQQGFDVTRNLVSRGNPELANASDMLGLAAMRGAQASEYQSNPIRQTGFDSRQTQKYMSPYMNEVIKRQKAALSQDFNEGRGNRNTEAIRAGAFGGYRSAIQEGVAQRGLGERLSDVEATGRQQAFENAQAQFERDRAASMSAQAQTEAQRLAAEQYGLSGAALGMQSAAALGQIGAMQQGLTLQQSEALQKQGAMQQQQDQRGLDVAYQDFLDQRDFDKQQLNFMSSILRGIPVEPERVTSQYQNQNPLAQLGGLGLAGYGLARSV
jgi:hypothetical protein